MRRLLHVLVAAATRELLEIATQHGFAALRQSYFLYLRLTKRQISSKHKVQTNTQTGRGCHSPLTNLLGKNGFDLDVHTLALREKQHDHQDGGSKSNQHVDGNVHGRQRLVSIKGSRGDETGGQHQRGQRKSFKPVESVVAERLGYEVNDEKVHQDGRIAEALCPEVGEWAHDDERNAQQESPKHGPNLLPVHSGTDFRNSLQQTTPLLFVTVCAQQIDENAL